MLSHGLLKNHAGILLIGDYTSLTWLHEVIHDVNERSPIVKDKDGPFLGLAMMCAKHMSDSASDMVSRFFGPFLCCSRGY